MLNNVEKEDFEYILNDKNINWKNFENSTVLITGASGMLPAYMVKTLLYLNKKIQQPIRVIGVVRNISLAQEKYREYLYDENLELLELDITKEINMNQNIDYIVHAASQASPHLFYSDPIGTIEANTLGTSNLLKLAKEKKVKGFLYFSSGEVYGDIFNYKNLVKEDDYGIVNPLDVRNCYAESKRLGENLCHCWAYQYGIPTRIVRPSHTYGAGFKPNDGRAFASFIMSIINGEDIVLKSDGSAKRSFVYIADATRAYFLVLLNGKNGEAYNVGNCNEISILELANLLVSLPENKTSKVRVELQKSSPSAKSSHGQLDIQKISTLGWLPKISEREGFEKTIISIKEIARTHATVERERVILLSVYRKVMEVA